MALESTSSSPICMPCLSRIQISPELSRSDHRFVQGNDAGRINYVPHPALDAAVALWRAATLVRNIGDIYGLEPTGLSSLRLLRHTITTAIIAVGADMATDAVVEPLIVV